MCPSFAYSKSGRSRVTRMCPNSRAVAAIIRSAGSRGGLPGKKEEAIKTFVGMSQSLTPGASKSRSNHRCGVMSKFIRPRAARSPISQAVIGDTYTSSPASRTCRSAADACCETGSSFESQITAHVSSSSGMLLLGAPRPVAPFGIRRFGKVEAGRNLHRAFEITDKRMLLRNARRR